MSNFLKTADLKQIIKQLSKEEITFSKAIEILNQKAKEHYPQYDLYHANFIHDIPHNAPLYDETIIKYGKQISFKELEMNFNGPEELSAINQSNSMILFVKK